MSSLLVLVKLNFLALLNMFGGVKRQKKKGSGSGIGILALLALLAIYISGVYSFMIAQSFGPAGMISELPPVMAIMTIVLSLVFTSFGAGGIIFGGKDMDLMMSLPISSFTVMLSKIMALYLENLVLCIFMMIPCGVVYIMEGGTGGVYFISMILLLTCFLAVIPTLFGILIGLFLTWIQSRTGGNALISNLFYLVMFIAAIVLSLRMNMVLAKSMVDAKALEHVFNTILYPIGLYRKGLLGNIGAAIWFAVLTAGILVIVVYLFSKKYKMLLSKLASHANRSDYKMQSLKASGAFGALLKKEFGRFWGTPIYFFNSGVGVIMTIGGSIYACFQRDRIELLLAQLGSSFGTVSPFILLSLIIGFMFVMTNPASVSVSLEGKTLWILKEAPVSARTVLGAKAVLNMVLIFGTSVICLPMIWYAFSCSGKEMLSLSLLCASLTLFVPSFGLLVNLKFPKMDGANDTLVVKQSKSSFIAILGGIAIVGGSAKLYDIVNNSISDLHYIFICAAVFGALGIVMFGVLFKNGQKYLLQL